VYQKPGPDVSKSALSLGGPSAGPAAGEYHPSGGSALVWRSWRHCARCRVGSSRVLPHDVVLAPTVRV
jgi:hypothetical protein